MQCIICIILCFRLDHYRQWLRYLVHPPVSLFLWSWWVCKPGRITFGAAAICVITMASLSQHSCTSCNPSKSSNASIDSCIRDLQTIFTRCLFLFYSYRWPQGGFCWSRSGLGDASVKLMQSSSQAYFFLFCFLTLLLSRFDDDALQTVLMQHNFRATHFFPNAEIWTTALVQPFLLLAFPACLIH